MSDTTRPTGVFLPTWTATPVGREDEVRAASAVVSGLVQGVFFRQSTANEAGALGLAGWVENLPDGRVRLWVEGEVGAVEALLAWCERGPPAARVSDVTVSWEAPCGLALPFYVRR